MAIKCKKNKGRLKNEEASYGLEDATRFVWDGKYTYIYTPGFLRVFGTNSRLEQRLERLATIAKNKNGVKRKSQKKY